MGDSLGFAIDAVGGGAAFILLFEGVRRLAAGMGSRRAALAMTVLGAAYCFLYGGYFLWKEHDTRQYVEALYRSAAPKGELPANWGEHLAPPRREASSLSLAREAYLQSGTLRGYFDAGGARKQFAPTQVDVRRRDRVVATQARLEESIRESFNSGVLWLVWGVIAVLFGFGMSRERIARPAA
jgi:hypothetical protein